MYPYEIFLGMDLYTILFAMGVILCMAFIRLQSDWRGLRAGLQNLFLFNTIAAVVLGYGCAVLLQAFYNFMAGGRFEITESTGATFYGGLIGGTALFIVIYIIRLLSESVRHVSWSSPPWVRIPFLRCPLH